MQLCELSILAVSPLNQLDRKLERNLAHVAKIKRVMHKGSSMELLDWPAVLTSLPTQNAWSVTF